MIKCLIKLPAWHCLKVCYLDLIAFRLIPLDRFTQNIAWELIINNFQILSTSYYSEIIHFADKPIRDFIHTDQILIHHKGDLFSQIIFWGLRSLTYKIRNISSIKQSSEGSWFTRKTSLVLNPKTVCRNGQSSGAGSMKPSFSIMDVKSLERLMAFKALSNSSS